MTEASVTTPPTLRGVHCVPPNSRHVGSASPDPLKELSASPDDPRTDKGQGMRAQAHGGVGPLTDRSRYGELVPRHHPAVWDLAHDHIEQY
jgi:hypothetical protein